jgi:hypothetical protein
LTTDYSELAFALNLDEKVAQNLKTIINAVRNWLFQNKNWLIVFDNVQVAEDIIDYLPQDLKGHVLITSRNKK